MNNKNFKEKGAPGDSAPIYELSTVVLIYFIAILLTPGIILIQIVNTNNTNMYLIHFSSKNNIKIHFPQSWVFKLQLHTSHSLFIKT